MLSLRHFSGWFSLSFGAWVPKNLARRRRLGPPGFRFIDFRAPRFPFTPASRTREGAAGQAVVCPLLRGSSPTRGVAPKQHRGLGRAFTPAFFGLVLFIPWRVGAEENLARRRRLGPPGFRFMVSAGAMLLDRLGPPGFRFRFIDFRAPRFPFTSATPRARGRCWPGRGLPVATG